MEQGGVYKIILYENRNFSVNYPEPTDAELVGIEPTTTGRTITLDFCNDAAISQTVGINANQNYSFEYQIKLVYFDLTPASRTLLRALNSRFGFYAIAFLRDGTAKFIDSVLSVAEITQDLARSNSRDITLVSQEPTESDFYETIEQDYLLLEDGTALLLEDGSKIILE